jgi:hypothetical protein
MSDTFKISLFFLFPLSCVLLFSCIKEEFDPKKLDTDIVINPTVAAPVGYIHYQLDEVLKDSTQSWNMIIDEDGLVSLYYESEIMSVQASEILQFSLPTESGSFRNIDTLPLDLNKIGSSESYKEILYDTVQFILIGPEGPDYTDIDSLQVESMTINMYLSPRYSLNGKLLLYSPKSGPGIYKMDSSGEMYPWGTSFGIPASDGSQLDIIEDCTIIPFHDSTGINLVPLIFEMRLTTSNAIVPPGYNILNYTFTIQNLDYSAIYGYLGKFNFNIDPQAIPIDFYNSIKGTFHFKEPGLNLYFENSFGLPLQILVNDLYAISGNGNPTYITGDGLPSEENIQVINYPTLAQFGKFAYDSLLIGNDDANFEDALDSSTNSMTLGLEVRTNTFENDTDNFIMDKSRLNVKARLILPLYGNTDLIIVKDSLIFNFNDFFKNPPEEIKTLTLRLNFTNGFPVDISTQVYFADENYAVMDSVFDEPQLIEAGTDTDGDGIVEPLQNDPIEQELTRTKIDHMADSRYLIIYGKLATTNNPQNYKFYSFYFLDAYIGIVGDLELNSTGN